jgi:tryptophan synthase alpha chain
MNRISRTFKNLRSKKEKAFIAFLTAGYPDLSATEKLVLEFSHRGVDMIELGIPFSDPMADGPVIQESSQAALKHNISLADVLAMVKRLRKLSDIPLLFMTYYNPVFCMGEDRFVSEAAKAGLDGIIIPDLPLEEGKHFTAACRKAGIDNILFVAPTTHRMRLKNTARSSAGFIYYISLAGVTGERKALPADVEGHVRNIKKITVTPVCVGFGVSTPGQVKQIQSVADGVIVGSAIIRKIKDCIGKPRLVDKVGAYVTKLMGKE